MRGSDMGRTLTDWRPSEDALQAASPEPCRRCGAEHLVGARFCSQCGQPVDEATPRPSLASMPVLAAAPRRHDDTRPPSGMGPVSPPARPPAPHPATASHPLPPGAVRDPRYFALLAWLMLVLYACPVCNPHRLVARHVTDCVCGWCGGTGWVRRS